MHSWCEISEKKLKQNFQKLRELSGDSALACVLKSNAYGHGLEPVYKVLSSLAPVALCLNYLYEAEELRQLGYKGRILLVGPSLPHELDLVYELKIELIVGSEGVLQAWLQHKNKYFVHLKFDTGLSRQGLFLEKAESYALQFRKQKKFLKGLTTHFANVEDVSNQNYAEEQLASLQSVADLFKDKGLSVKLSAAASAPTLIMARSRFELCRVGISLYGFWPSDLTKLSYLSQKDSLLGLEPVLSWHTRVVSTRTIKAGTFVGYGCSYRSSSQMKIATISVGYNEGYSRALSQSGAYVLCQGQRCPVLGRVCMNMVIVDVSSCEKVELGDKVTLIGEQGQERIRAEDLAEWAKTIQYEIVTRIHPRVPRYLV